AMPLEPLSSAESAVLDGVHDVSGEGRAGLTSVAAQVLAPAQKARNRGVSPEESVSFSAGPTEPLGSLTNTPGVTTFPAAGWVSIMSRQNVQLSRLVSLACH